VSIFCNELTKHFEHQVAVNAINLNISKGEVVGFLGPNGAGKSTTMKMITGYLKPSSGAVEVCGEAVTEENLLIKSKIGYLPENNPLYYDMYVVEYLEFIAAVHKLKNTAARINEVIDLTGLGSEKHKQIGALSKGYKQRVGLCQAIIHNPEVLILDEPTSGLDPNQLLDIRNLIVELGKTKTILLSSHIMQEVEAMCSRIVVINKGNIVADKSLQQLRNSNSTGGASVLLVCKQDINNSIFGSSFKGIDIEQVTAKSLKFTCNDADAAKKMIMQKCLDADLDIDTLHTETQSLENLFRTLTA
jgi:ABC-2 type transport system ATP-binding protein